MEFAELRDYYPGDDLRRLDWKAYGRSDRFFLKEYESETNARAYFLLDSSGSMNFKGEEGKLRLEFGKQIIAALSSLFLYQGDAVGIVREEVETLVAPLLRGEYSLGQVLDGLEAIEAGGETKLSSHLHKLMEQVPRRSLIVIVSDFLTPLDELENALQHLRHCAHEVTLLQVLSSRELELEDSSTTAFKDMETGRVLKTNPRAVREEYTNRLRAHQEELEKVCARNRTTYLLFQQESGVEESLRTFFEKTLEQS